MLVFINPSLKQFDLCDLETGQGHSYLKLDLVQINVYTCIPNLVTLGQFLSRVIAVVAARKTMFLSIYLYIIIILLTHFLIDIH
jgi:hypothetical protein